ncbi:hypothetical protein QBC46DRAFT_387212 [Diplogelasinospora grovesii]|uniref:Uncharacterized protein n=1 Tax=Diplogelasinospora grovesii TaxID=303347 RepID=A0AAN6N723_9PEZI|nr:hypothetical protein QBC46DRAFT_387212 [Diplogelasinospora grovesii]
MRRERRQGENEKGALYVSYGSYNISVARLTDDGVPQKMTKLLYTYPPCYTHPLLMSTSRATGCARGIALITYSPRKWQMGRAGARVGQPLGTYTMRRFVITSTSPVDGTGHPDNTRRSLAGGKGRRSDTWHTTTVTTGLFSARNTLTRRILSPHSSGTFHLDVSGLRDGDRDRRAYIGVSRDGSNDMSGHGGRPTPGQPHSNGATPSNGTVAGNGHRARRQHVDGLVDAHCG